MAVNLALNTCLFENRIYLPLHGGPSGKRLAVRTTALFLWHF